MSPFYKNIGNTIKSLPIIGSPPAKPVSGRQFIGKNPPRPDGRRGGFFAGKLSAGEENFFGGDPIMGHRRRTSLQVNDPSS